MNHEKPTVLIVDDAPENLQVLLSTLKNDFAILVATSGEEALELSIKEPQPDIILLDIMMPVMDGYEVCKRLKDNELTKYIPVIFVTALNENEDEKQGLTLGAVDYITKPINHDLVKARVINHIELKRHRDNLQQLVNEQTMQLKHAKETTIAAMGIVAESRDSETGGHIQRTKNYVRVLAERLSQNPKYSSVLTEDMIEQLYQSAPLHDIGKINIPDKILLKPGKLNDAERKIMKQHAAIGEATINNAQLRLEESDFLNIAKEIAGTHHEKWDGSGYPNGLSGLEIPLSGRLMALADVYDALISKRSYKPPFGHENVVKIIQDERAKHFDPEIVDVFLELNEEFHKIALEFTS